jgi:hypothetical protein
VTIFLAQSVLRQATGWKAVVRFPAEEGDLSLLHSVRTCSGAYRASSPMGTGSGDEAGHSPSSSMHKNGGIIPPLRHVLSWHVA